MKRDQALHLSAFGSKTGHTDSFPKCLTELSGYANLCELAHQRNAQRVVIASIAETDHVSTSEHGGDPMRNIVYGAAVMAGIFLVAIAVGRSPRTATASHDNSSETVNVLKLGETMNTKALPRQEIPPEVYQ